jgi:hypothetical protein
MRLKSAARRFVSYTGRISPTPPMRRTAFLLSLLLVPAVSFADSGDVMTDTTVDGTTDETIIPEGQGTIIIEQVALAGTLGSWMLSSPDQTERTGAGASQTLSDIPSGKYVVYATLPSGTVSTIRVYKNDVLDKSFDRQQTPFAVYPGDVIRISINYRLENTGSVSVQSDPEGTVFTLSGPDNLSLSGVTPQTFQNLPEGQYKVQYENFDEGCVKPAPKADQLVREGRIGFNITFDCEAATKVRARKGKDDAKYLTIVADGKDVQLQDVLQKDWFSTYVFEAAKRDILSGYRDEKGDPTGTFGPGNSVTVAELTKIAHRMAGIDEASFKNTAPKNGSGAGQWFSPFLASSENRGWIIYADGTIDPVRPATRGEVMVTLMQAFEIPLAWQKGNVFTDVPVTHRYAAAIETAAKAEVIAGRTDQDGKSTGLFDPEAPITRAEIAKIITTMLDTYKSPTTLRKAADRQRD